MKDEYIYPWPASALTAEDMAALYSVRENADLRVPITRLIALAVRHTYAARYPGQNKERGPHLTVLPAEQPTEQRKEEAA